MFVLWSWLRLLVFSAINVSFYFREIESFIVCIEKCLLSSEGRWHTCTSAVVDLGEISSWPQDRDLHVTSILCFDHILLLGSLWPDLCLVRKVSFFVCGTSSFSSLGKNAHFPPGVCRNLLLVSVIWAYEIRLKGSRDENFLSQLLHVCCHLPPFVHWSANPDNCFVPSGFYHSEEPIRLGDSEPLLESTCSCSRISTFCATGHPHGQVTSFFLSSVSLWKTG